MKRCFALMLMVLLAGIPAVQAQSLDDQYLQIFGQIQEGDSLVDGQPAQAFAKYTEAQIALQKLQKENPGWNSSVVNFRLGYVADRLKALSAKVPSVVPAPDKAPTISSNASPATAPAPSKPAPPPAPSDWAQQINGLKEQARQLQEDKQLLEAKLKEAFAAQPAQVDPREFARAEEKIKALQKENDLLKVTLDQQKTKPAGAALDPKALEQTKQALAESNRQLEAQKASVSQLMIEKQALQERLRAGSVEAGKLASLSSENETLKKQLAAAKATSDTGPKSEDVAKQLALATQQLATAKDAAAKLALEKQALENRLKAAGTGAEKASALMAENETLKKQLAATKANAVAPVKLEDNQRQLTQAQTQVASLQSEKEAWQVEKAALENRIQKLSSTTVTSRVLPPASSPEDLAQIRDLERQREVLQKKLEAADKALYGRKGKVVAGKVEELEGQLATMRARLEIFEARQVAYSAEELALMKTPAIKVNEPAPVNAGKKSVRELPPGSVAQIAEAQRYFAAKQYDKAEAIYEQVLREDRHNVSLLANLAAIEVEARHFDAADANLRQALNVDPEDAYSLYVLGILHFRQAHYDAALDALSRAAKLDSKNAEIQNYLGLTLSEKGMRAPAEAAFRKAVELQPAYGSAHVNLAVFYITQDPPYAALARWHYQKALDSGHPHNPTLEKMLEEKK